MELYQLDNLTLREIRALRKSLDFIPITGGDAMFMGTLQIKMNDHIQQIESHINSLENEKNQKLEQAVTQDKKISKIASLPNK